MKYLIFFFLLLKFILSDQSYDNKTNIVCTIDNCKRPYGTCSEDKTTCLCTMLYASYQEENGPYCQYERKKQKTYMLLEGMLGFGVGHFVNGHFIIGAIKMALPLMAIGFGYLFCAPCTAKYQNNGHVQYFILILSLVPFVAYVLFYFVDIFMILFSGYADGKGVPLLQW